LQSAQGIFRFHAGKNGQKIRRKAGKKMDGEAEGQMLFVQKYEIRNRN